MTTVNTPQTNPTMTVCDSCGRHVRGAACPFCGAGIRRAPAAMLLGVVAIFSACHGGRPQREQQSFVAMYGGPPPGWDEHHQVIKTIDEPEPDAGVSWKETQP